MSDRFRMTKEEKVDGLRQAWHDRVTKDFCLTPEEVAALLDKVSVPYILQAYNDLGKFLKREREQNLMFYSESDIVDVLLPKVIEQQRKIMEAAQCRRN